MSRLPPRDTGTELGDVLVIGGRTSIPDHILGQGDPAVDPNPDPDPEPPPPLSPKDQAIEDLRNALRAREDLALTPADRQLMRDHGIKLSDLLKPGIYQMEFDVAAVAEHRQWVRVNADGTSELMSGRPDGNGNLIVDVGPYEEHDHGGGGGTVFGDLRIHPQPFADEAVLDVIWNAMLAAADHINDNDFHYNLFLQNSNSAFNTLSVAGGLDDHDTGFALGQGRNLFEVDPANQPPRLSTGDHSQVSGGSGSDILIGSGGPSEIQGGDGADQITGGSLYDILEGGGGNDTISILGGVVGGGLGDDTITASVNATAGVIMYGDEGADSITGTAHADGIEGGEGNDIVNGGLGDDQIYGWVGDDQLNGGGGVDWIMGEDGQDTANGGDGNDVMSGGNGTDTLSGGAGDDLIFGAFDENSLGGPDADWIDGGSGNDILYGGVNVDTIYGGDGDDIITGGARGDHLWGGAGADAFRWGWTGDSADPSINPASPLGIDKIYDFVSGVDKLDMSELDIVLWSPSRIDSLYWWTANGSTFVAWDMMGMGAVNPSYPHSALIELVGVTSLSMSDFLLPKDDLVLVGGNFADNLRGMDGNDTLRGRGGADTLNGGAGSDTADYALATSAVTARLDTMVASNDGTGSADTLVSIENLTGSIYNDLLIGNGGANVLNGAAGTDTLLGMAGNDILIGGPGVPNQLQGGLGDDIFVIEANDTVVEFVGEGTDTVQTVRTIYTLAANVENLTYTGAAAFAGTGNALNNALTGGDAADTLSGGVGDDTLTGGKSNDTLHGGDGSDTVVLAGLQADYAFSAVSGGYQATDSVAGRDGVDTLTGVEFIRFGDGSTVLLSSLIGSGSPGLSSKDLDDDPFVLPGDLDGSVFGKTFDEPLILPHDLDGGFDPVLEAPVDRFAGEIAHLVDDGLGQFGLWQFSRDQFDQFV